jgi:hypothetical protein
VIEATKEKTMARSTRRFLALAALSAAILAPSASAYPDSFRQEFSVSSGLAAKMRIEDRPTQAHGGPRFLIEGPAHVSSPVLSSAAPDSGSVDLSAALIGLAAGAALAGGALALLISRDARPTVSA